jgi:hypothetical protein
VTVDVVVAVLLVIAFLLGWYFTHRNTALIPAANVKKIIVDFDEKKKAEAVRIDAETPSQLRDDFNSGK